MVRTRLFVGTLSLFAMAALGICRAALNDNGSNQVSTLSASNSVTAPATGAASVPAGGLAGDANDSKRLFTVTASLREEYDDNIFTAKTGRVSSAVTEFSPSVLFDLPMQDSDFSARYTFGLDYYSNRPGDTLDLTHEFVAQFRHSFSDRFNLDLAEQFRYYTEPSLFENTGTLFRNGAYISNTVNGDFTGQWTPLISTTTTYANTIVKYENSTVSQEQDNMENTASQSIGFAILPKINLVFAAIVDNISYDDISRGYTTYTGDTGLDWQALPSLSVSGRIGGTYTDAEQSGSSVSPYASASVRWQLGARSSLSFDYAHDVVPTDVFVAEAQVADRFSSIFRYDITPSISTHLEGTCTHGEYTQSLITPGTISSFSENDFAIDTGFTYHYNHYLDFDAGYTFSGVSSGLDFRDYTRDQVYLGIRGTY